MPILKNSTYQAPFLFKNPHLNTIYPALFRKVKGVNLQRVRLETPDDDFLDLDFSKIGSSKIAIVLHGLEGKADRHYMKGMMRNFNQNGWDAVGMNHRSCSGEINRKPQGYHMGWTTDLGFVIETILENYPYKEIVLVGFSLGGNLILKYLGENSGKVKDKIKKSVVFSVPCDITTANLEFNKTRNKLYMFRFMRSLNAKMKEKAVLFPDTIKFDNRNPPKTFNEFDELFTAPLHGFKNAQDYWTKGSSKPFLRDIKIPTLMVQAQDDTFLSPECYPFDIAKKHPFLHLEIPKFGGHVGFTTFNKRGVFWSEKRAMEFITNQNI